MGMERTRSGMKVIPVSCERPRSKPPWAGGCLIQEITLIKLTPSRISCTNSKVRTNFCIVVSSTTEKNRSVACRSDSGIRVTYYSFCFIPSSDGRLHRNKFLRRANRSHQTAVKLHQHPSKTNQWPGTLGRVSVWQVNTGRLVTQAAYMALSPGGGLPYKTDGDARRKIRIKPLKETNLGVVQALFDP